MADPIPEITVEKELSNIGPRLQGMFVEDMAQRRWIELEWQMDLRQYSGEYGASVRFQKNASRAFVRLTRTKVKAMDARLGELVFPAATDAWSIAPTPLPDIPPDRSTFLAQTLKQLMKDEGGEVREPEKAELVAMEIELAKAAAKGMTVKIRDVLVESRWRHVAQKVYHSAHLYGTGILKGPLVEKRKIRHWARIDGGAFAMVEKEILAPFLEHVPIWDYFPDMTARSLWDTEHQSQYHVMGRERLLNLATRPLFRGDALRRIISGSPEGDADWQVWETEMFRIGRLDTAKTAPQPKNKYALVETWFLSDAQDMAREGIELPEEFRGKPIEGYAWWSFTTGELVKLTLNPFESGKRPFSFYVPEPEEGRVFGCSIPYTMRDTQQLFNASARMMVDNAARAVAPQIEMDKRRIAGNRDPLNMYPGRIWFVDEALIGNNQQAIRTVDFPLHAATFLQISNVVKTWIDESTAIPSFSHGERSPGVGRTVGGLSLLMGAANVMLKEPLRAWDECFERHIRLLYDWFMQFDPDPDIKGDFNVEVRGTHSMLAKEFMIEKLDSFLGRVANPLLAPFVDFHELLLEIAETMEIKPGIVKSMNEVAKEQAMQQQIALSAGGQGGGAPPTAGQAVNTGTGGPPIGPDGGDAGPGAGAAQPTP